MKYTPGFTDFFISPVTGRFITNTLIPLQEDYILIGDRNNQSIASPALIDVRLNIIGLRIDLIGIRTLLANAKFLLQQAKEGLESSQALDTVANGMISNQGGIIVPTTLTHNYTWIGDENNLPVETDTFPIGSLPDLTDEHLWRGNSSNRPEEVQTIALSNLPGLTFKNIWRGDPSNRPEESTVVTSLEGDMDYSLAKISYLLDITDTLLSLYNSLEDTVNTISSGIIAAGGIFGFLGLGTIMAALSNQIKTNRDNITDLGTRIDNLENEFRTDINILIAQVADLYSKTAELSSRIDNLRLNDIPADADVSIHGFKLINVANPINPQDAATRFYVDNAISGIPGSIIITLGGAVSGTGPSNTTINTTFNWTLNQIAATNPTTGSVALNDHRIIALADPELEQDAVNLRYLENSIETLDVTLEGFVEGGPAVDGVITTTRGPDCLLTNIPAGGDVDMDGFRIKNLNQSPEENLDAISAQFLWDLMHDNVGVVWE